MVYDNIAEAITEYWGERCPDFDEGCFVCSAWKQYDDLRALASPAANPSVMEALANLIDDVQEWCDAVGRDTSWDSWDSHYKGLANLDSYRAALTAALQAGSSNS